MPPTGILHPLIQTHPIWWRKRFLQRLTVPQKQLLTALKKKKHWCDTLPCGIRVTLIIGVHCRAAFRSHTYTQGRLSTVRHETHLHIAVYFQVSATCWKVEKCQSWAAGRHKSSQTNPEFAKQKNVLSSRHISSTQHCEKGSHCSYKSGLTASAATLKHTPIHLWGTTTEVAVLCYITANKTEL